MPISPKAIAELQSLYSQEYGVVLSVGEAEIKARTLLELFKILAAAPPEEEPFVTPLGEGTALNDSFPILHSIEQDSKKILKE